ncbi:hypothetical protein FE249_21015 (plasmid) [Acidiphilium multivorum]|uniref:hypothetical protein n=1 Tax=Acidiphilium multivorum TaxID=62140 RepID=UPI001CDD87DC|nr:hypothetical protein [Acidiphilium multivorum]UBU64060.1 hypothetical protein LDB30_15835 [Acidithiobacillus ferrooxidans]UNC16657.1 hypothetical protein FE249_21015 [Acidiphilium multivorum]
MDTPWGPLAGLKLDDPEEAVKILAADKHQLIEGLVVESLFDQIVASVPESTEQKIIALDVDSAVIDTMRRSERWLCLVWARTESEGLGRYLQALEKCVTPYLVRYRNGEFEAVRIREGRRAGNYHPLPELMQELSGSRMTRFEVDPAVRNVNRQKQAFWGFLSEHYGNRLGNRVVLPRILMNCGIQPYFRRVWNLDRVFISGNSVWIFEIKHKYPIAPNTRRQSVSPGALHFGINDGELGMLQKLSDTGIRCLHTILVKPVWSKDAGSMYLLNDLEMRSRAAVIALALDSSKIHRIMGGRSGQSAAHTSITGKSMLSYKRIPASDFSVLGRFSDPPQDIARRIAAIMAETAMPHATDMWISDLRKVAP